MVLVAVVGASGIRAAATLPLIAVAPASTAAVPRSARRDIIGRFLSWSVSCRLGGGFRQRTGIFGLGSRPAAPHHGDAEVGGCQPEITLRLDRRDGGGHPPPRLPP